MQPDATPITLDDIIMFLHNEAECQTLTEKDITRCVMLAYEMGVTSGRGEAYTLLADVRTLLEKEERNRHAS
jgi:hypothetical protein